MFVPPESGMATSADIGHIDLSVPGLAAIGLASGPHVGSTLMELFTDSPPTEPCMCMFLPRERVPDALATGKWTLGSTRDLVGMWQRGVIRHIRSRGRHRRFASLGSCYVWNDVRGDPHTIHPVIALDTCRPQCKGLDESVIEQTDLVVVRCKLGDCA